MRAKVGRIKKSLVQILFFQIIKIDKTRLFKLVCVFFVLKLFEKCLPAIKKQKILGEKQILHISIFTFIYFCTEELTLNVSTESKQ